MTTKSDKKNEFLSKALKHKMMETTICEFHIYE